MRIALDSRRQRMSRSEKNRYLCLVLKLMTEIISVVLNIEASDAHTYFFTIKNGKFYSDPNCIFNNIYL